MPFYRYVCPSCNDEVTLMRKVLERDLPVKCCPCERPMDRAVAAPSFALKGGGWYADGYAKKE